MAHIMVYHTIGDPKFMKSMLGFIESLTIHLEGNVPDQWHRLMVLQRSRFLALSLKECKARALSTEHDWRTFPDIGKPPFQPKNPLVPFN
jgi:hypothetical protein